jgi:hypothetical protein
MDDGKDDNPAPAPGTVAVKTKDGRTVNVVPIESSHLPAKELRVEREDVDYAAVERIALAALASAVARADLTDSQKQQARDGFTNLILGLRRNATWVVDAFYLGTVGRLSVEEVETVYDSRFKNEQRKRARLPRKPRRPWPEPTIELVRKIVSHDPDATNGTIVGRIMQEWPDILDASRVKCPSHSVLTRFMKKLRGIAAKRGVTFGELLDLPIEELLALLPLPVKRCRNPAKKMSLAG